MNPGSVMVMPSVRAAVEFCWRLCTYFQSLGEDLDGIDGRAAYFENLRIRIVETTCELEALRSGELPPGAAHRLALALEQGLPQTAGVGGDALVDLLWDDPALPLAARQDALREIFRTVLDCGPGPVANPFAPSGQRQILKALQGWSDLGADCGEDLAFLAGRLDSL